MAKNANSLEQFTALDLVPVTPDDNEDLALSARAIRCVGTGGTLRITTTSGQVRNTSISDGEVLLVQTNRVHSTGTTATNLEAML